MKNIEQNTTFEDIRSSTPRRMPDFSAKAYSEGAFKNIDKVIKAIAVIVAVCILLLFAAVAAVLVLLDKIFLILSIGILVFGIILSLIFMYLIFGLGHIITQNKEILRRL